MPCPCCHTELGKFASALVLLGGVNWGLIGIGRLSGNDMNLIQMSIGNFPMFETFVYILIGICAVLKAANACR